MKCGHQCCVSVIGPLTTCDGQLLLYDPTTAENVPELLAPAQLVHESNWLPAPASNFILWLRVYIPGAAILDGQYNVPPVAKVN